MDWTSLLRRGRRAMICAAPVLAILLAQGAAAGGSEGEKIVWEPVDGAQVKIDDKVPLSWNAYQPERKEKKKYGDLVIVLLGRRYILLDTKAKLAYEIELTDLQKDGSDLETTDLRRTAQQIPSIDWSSRDVGPEQLIQLTLRDYGRRVSVSIPHPPDLRAFY